MGDSGDQGCFTLKPGSRMVCLLHFLCGAAEKFTSIVACSGVDERTWSKELQQAQSFPTSRRNFPNGVV